MSTNSPFLSQTVPNVSIKTDDNAQSPIENNTEDSFPASLTSLPKNEDAEKTTEDDFSTDRKLSSASISHSRYDARSSKLTPSLRSMHSSVHFESTAFVASKRDRLRYSWQSLQADELNRPRIHVIRIVSEIATASAALPGGEALGFSISTGGRRIACYNSARLFILQTAALPVNISQEYALKRRPLAVEINDEGNVLAVLVDSHTIHVYNLTSNQSRPLNTCKTDYPCNTIALSPTGALIAVAYDDGLEVFSLAPNALTTDRRAARSPRVDSLTFSPDSSSLVGTTTQKDTAATVVISVPVFPHSSDGVASPEELKEAWCTGMLQTQNLEGSSHAALIPDTDSTAVEKLFAWNSRQDTFSAVGVDNQQQASSDFLLTVDPPLSTIGGLGAAVQSLPTIDEHGTTIGMIINERTIRLYIVPEEGFDAKVEAHSVDHELDEEFGNPFTHIKWVHSHADLPAPRLGSHNVQGRMLIISPGSSMPLGHDEESTQVREGGRIILFDFDPQYAGQPGQTYTFMLGKAPPTLLREEQLDEAAEIALVRRRTLKQSQASSAATSSPLLARNGSTPGSKGEQNSQTWNSPTTPYTPSPISASFQRSPVTGTGYPSHLSADDATRPGADTSLSTGLPVMSEIKEVPNTLVDEGLMPTTPHEDRMNGSGSGASVILDYVAEGLESRPLSTLSSEKPEVVPTLTDDRSYIYTGKFGYSQAQGPTHLPRALRRTYERAANQASLWAANESSSARYYDAANKQANTDDGQQVTTSALGDGLSALRIKTDQPQGKPPTLLNRSAEPIEMPDSSRGRSSTERSPGKTPLTATPHDSSAGGASPKLEWAKGPGVNTVEDLFNEPLAVVGSRDASGHERDGMQARSRSRRRKRVGSRHALDHEIDENKCTVM